MYVHNLYLQYDMINNKYVDIKTIYFLCAMILYYESLKLVKRLYKTKLLMFILTFYNMMNIWYNDNKNNK